MKAKRQSASQPPGGALTQHVRHEPYQHWTEEQTDDLIARIAVGERLADIAASHNVTRWAVIQHLYGNPHRSARARDAQAMACLLWDQLAEDVIRNAPADPIEIQRARELAQHYRWRASRLAPALYGDRVEIKSQDEPAAIPVRDLLQAAAEIAQLHGISLVPPRPAIECELRRLHPGPAAGPDDRRNTQQVIGATMVTRDGDRDP